MTEGFYGNEGQFNQIVLKLRRHHVMDAMMKEGAESEFGNMVLVNVKKQLMKRLQKD